MPTRALTSARSPRVLCRACIWLNSEFVATQAKALDERLIKEAGDDAAERIDRAYQLLYARPPDAAEAKLGVEYVSTGGTTRGCTYLQALLSAAEFAA